MRPRIRTHHHHEPGFLAEIHFLDRPQGHRHPIRPSPRCAFLLFGFSPDDVMRWQIAHPGKPIPMVGPLAGRCCFERRGGQGRDVAGSLQHRSARCTARSWCSWRSCRWLSGAFGNYLVPLQIGASDMAFPRLNMVSYQFYFLGGVIMFASFFIPGGAAQAGWTSYSPLSLAIPTDGQTYWLIGMVFLITSSLLGSVNIIATIVQLRAPGMTWMRLPFFVWSQFVAAFLLLLAFPPLEAAGVMQLMDKVFGTSFFLPTGLAVGGQAGGRQRRRQPAAVAAFVLVPGASGSLRVDSAGDGHHVAKSSPTTPASRSGATNHWFIPSLALGFISFIVWAHHMYLTGMGTKIATFFQTTTMMISIPSVIILTCLLISLWGGSIRFNTPMLFALAFLPMFGIGGLTGLPLGFSAQRSAPARHLLRHRPLPLRRGAGNDLRALRGSLFLVSRR